MEAANPTQVRVTLVSSRDDCAGNLCGELLGAYVHPPRSASLRMYGGKRIFERVCEGKGTILGYSDWFLFFSDYYCCWLVGRERDMDADAGWLRSCICNDSSKAPTELDPPTTNADTVKATEACNYPTHPPWQYYDGNEWKLCLSLRVVVERLALSPTPEPETTKTPLVDTNVTAPESPISPSQLRLDSDESSTTTISPSRSRVDSNDSASMGPKPLFGPDGALIAKKPRHEFCIGDTITLEKHLVSVEARIRLIPIDRKYTGQQVVDYFWQLLMSDSDAETDTGTNRPRSESKATANSNKIIVEAWRKHQAKKQQSVQMIRKLDDVRSLLQTLDSPSTYAVRSSGRTPFPHEQD